MEAIFSLIQTISDGSNNIYNKLNVLKYIIELRELWNLNFLKNIYDYILKLFKENKTSIANVLDYQ